MIAAAIEAMGEASALVRAHGVSGNEFLAMMGETLFACPVYQGYGAAIADERYSPAGFALRLGYKDARLALAAGDDAHVPLPLAALVRDGFLDALAHGDGELDWAALAEVAARHAHLDRRAKK
jgi:3-hydroxyisobutyrate dehydrogenase-like beta-hydroxyacid dehydrogenase